MSIPFDCMLGDIRVTRVEEDVRPASKPADWFTDYNEAEFNAILNWLAPDYYSPALGRLISSVHTWVLRTPARTILVDTCTGNHKNRPDWPVFHMLNTPYLARLKAAGVDPAEVDLVLCTHLHVDHVGWNTQLDNGRWTPTFPNARYLASKRDFEHYERLAGMPATDPTTRNTFVDSVLPIAEAGLLDFITGEEELDQGLQLVPAPGHTPGQVRLDLKSGTRLACFCGDVLHHPLQVPLWHWRTRVDTDPEQGRDTRRDILTHCSNTGALLLPAHFAHPHGGYIKQSGRTFVLRWPETPGGMATSE